MSTTTELIQQLTTEGERVNSCREEALNANAKANAAKQAFEEAKASYDATYSNLCKHLFEDNRQYCAEQRQQGNLVYLIANAVYKTSSVGKRYISFTVVDGEDKHRTLSLFLKWRDDRDDTIDYAYCNAREEVDKRLTAIVKVKENDRGYLELCEPVNFCRTIAAFEKLTKEASVA